MYFHFDYLNEQIKKIFPRRADQAGVFIVSIADSSASADIARTIDAEFKNSLAETLTETEKAFTLAFVAMIETIIVAIEGVSYVVILIIMAVAANTMAMTARERLSEYATLKALGFPPRTVALLILAEAMLLAALGGAIGMLLTPPVVQAVPRRDHQRVRQDAAGAADVLPAGRVRAGGRRRRGRRPGVPRLAHPDRRRAAPCGLIGVGRRRCDGAAVAYTTRERMKIPLNYVARNLWVRKLTTALTAGGMALVVFVFAAVLMLDAGLKTTLVSTGSVDNVVVIRQGSQTEVQSGILRDQAALIETAPEVARGRTGGRWSRRRWWC